MIKTNTNWLAIVPFFVDLHYRMKHIIPSILLILSYLWGYPCFGQSASRGRIQLRRLTYLTTNIDSLTRSFAKRGYSVQTGLREPDGILNDVVNFPNGSKINIETTQHTETSDWRVYELKKYGTHVSGIEFDVADIDSVYANFQQNSISVGPLISDLGNQNGDSLESRKYFGLHFCFPIDFVFFSHQTSKYFKVDSSSRQKNGVYRIDWIILSASSEVEREMRAVFSLLNLQTRHDGCCDFWRIGAADDFCYVRFEHPPEKAAGRTDWLSIEPDGIYFAY